VGNEFQWVDFALQAPCAMVESLEAAGIDGGVPRYGQEEDAPSGE